MEDNNIGYYDGLSESIEGLKGLSGLKGLNYKRDNAGINNKAFTVSGFDGLAYKNYQYKYKDYYDANPERDSAKAYARKVMKDEVGIDAYNAKYKGLPFDEQVDKFNREYDLRHPKKDTFDMVSEESINEMGIRENQEIADTLDKEYETLLNELDTISKSDDPNRLLKAAKLQDAIEANRDVKDNLKYNISFTDDEIHDLIDDEYYMGKYYDESKNQTTTPHGKQFIRDVENYANKIYKNALDSDIDRSKYMQLFENAAISVDPYYRESLKYNNGEPDEDGMIHEIKPFVSDMDKPKLMAKYLAINALTGNDNIANAWLAEELNRMRGDNTRWYETAYNMVRGIGSSAASSTVMLAGFIANNTAVGKMAINAMNGDPIMQDVRPFQAAFNIADAVKNRDNEEIGWFDQLMLNNAVNNPLTMYGYNIQQTGEYMPDKIKYNLENEINDLDVSYSDAATIVQQSGYTTASTIATVCTGGIAGAIQWGAKKAAKTGANIAIKTGIKKAATQEAKKAIIQAAEKFAEKASSKVLKWYVVPSVQSYAERTSDAIDVYNQVLESGMSKLEQAAYEDMAKKLDYDPSTGTFSDPDFNKYYHERATANNQYTELYNYIKNNYGDNYLPENEEDAQQYNSLINKLNELAKQASPELDKIAKEYYEEKYGKIIDSDAARKKIEAEAARAFVRTSIVEGVIIGTTDLALSKFFTPLNKTLGKMYSGSINKYIGGKAGEFVAKGSSYVGKVLRDSISEGVEEGLQNITQDVSTALSDDSINTWFYSQLDPDSANELGGGMLHSMGVAFNAFGDSITSKETFEAAKMGFFGGLLGAANTPVTAIKQARQVSRDRAKYGYTNAETALAYVNAVWRSPMFYAATERRQEITTGNAIARELNEKFENDPQFKAAFEGQVGMINYTKAFADARKRDNKLDMDEADFGSYVASINALSKMKGTKEYDKFFETLNSIKNASIEDPAMKDAIDKMRDELDANSKETLSDEDIFGMVKQRVSDFEKISKEYSEKMNEISEAYDGVIDDRTKNTLVYTELTKENREKMKAEREETLQKELEKNDFFKDQNEQQSSLSETVKNLIAKYGSVENAKKKLSEEQKKKIKDRSLTKNQLERLKKDIKNADKLEEQSKSGVLSASEIMKLNPIERAEILNKKNRNKYSKEQQEVLKEIDNAGLSEKAITAINENASIQQMMDRSTEILNDVKSSNDKLFNFQRDLYLNATFKRLSKVADGAKQAKSYEEFEKIMDENVNNGKLSDEDLFMIGSLMRTQTMSNFYNKYINRKGTDEFAKQTVDKIPMIGNRKHNKISKMVLDKLVAKSKSGAGYKYADALAIFESDEFKNDLKKIGIDFDSMNEATKTDILQDIADYVKTLNNAVTNFNTSQKIFNEEHTSDNREIAPEGQKETLIDKRIYEGNKELINPILDKLANMFMGSNDKLSRSELYIITTLFSRDNTMPIDADTSNLAIFDTDISSLKDFNGIIKDIKQLIKGRKALFGSTQNVDMMAQMLRGLNAIREKSVGITPIEVIANAVLEVNPEYANKFNKLEREKLEKRRKSKLGKSSEMKVSIKVEQNLTDENEKKYYKDHHITDNQVWVCEHIEPRNVKVRLMRTDELLTKEVSEYNSDNYPLAVVIKVGKETPNATKVGNDHYLIVGIAENSRKYVTEESTAMNEARDLMMLTPGEETEILRYDNGDFIEFGGWNLKKVTPNKNNLNNDYVSITNYLTKPVSEGGLGLSKNEALKHFKENIVVVETVYEKKNGKIFRIDRFDYGNRKGIIYTNEVPSGPRGLTDITDPIQYKNIAYINPNQKDSPKPVLNFLFTDMTKISYDGRTLDDLMLNENLFDPKFNEQGIALVHNMLRSLVNVIGMHSRKILKDDNIAVEETRKLRDDFWKTANGYFNFMRTKIVGSPYTFDFYYDAKARDIRILCNYNARKQSFININEGELKGFKKHESGLTWQQRLQQFMMDSILVKNIDGSYSYRKYEYGDEHTEEFEVKPQISYDKFEILKKQPDDESANKFLNMYFNSGVLYMNKETLSQGISGIESTLIGKQEEKKEDNKPVIQKEVSEKGRQVIEDTMNSLLAYAVVPQPDPKNYKDGENDVNYIVDREKFDKYEAVRENHKKAGNIGVTTFIKKGEVKPVDNEATNYGTGIDTAVRMSFEKNETPSQTIARIKEMVRKQKGYASISQVTPNDCPFPGFNWTMLKQFLTDVQTNLGGFFEDRGEKVVPFEMKLWATLESSGGKYANLTMVPDIVTVDEHGGIHIYDMKSYRTSDFASYKSFDSFKPFGLKVTSGPYLEENINDSWRKQVSLYSHIFNKATGLTVESVGIIPIPVFYNKNTSGVNNIADNEEVNPISKTKNVYSNDLKSKKNFTANPKVYNDAIKVDVIPIDQIESDKWVDKNIVNGTNEQVSNKSTNDLNEGGIEPNTNEGNRPDVKTKDNNQSKGLLDNIDPRVDEIGEVSDKPIDHFPNDMAYRETDINELKDIIEYGSMRMIPEGKEVEGGTREIKTKDGKTVRFGKRRGNSEGGKGFAKGAPWSTTGGSVATGKAQRIVIGVKGDKTQWSVGFHGSYSEPTNFSSIENGKPLFLRFDKNGEITGLSVEDMQFWALGKDGKYYEIKPTNKTNTKNQLIQPTSEPEGITDIHTNTQKVEEEIDIATAEIDPLKILGLTEDDVNIDDILDELEDNCPL